jgi:PP-loop superfamily ATP-utilizing enzyme
MRTGKQIYEHAIRTKWPYKKHTHASVQQIYETRGRISRKLKVLGVNRVSLHLTLYNASKRLSKRVTNGYSRRHAGG